MARPKLPKTKPHRRDTLVTTAHALEKPIEQFMEGLELAKDVNKLSSGMVIGEQTKYVSWAIPSDQEFIEILQITDVQFGHVRCKYHRVLEYRDWILKEPNRYMVWTGDLVDAWAMWSPGRGFEQIGDPMSQVFKFCEVWAPARHRVLGYVGGNHERRAIPGFGDLGVLLAALLRVPYSNGRQLIDIYYGKHQPFQISQWHGRGGARTKGTVAQTLHRFAGEGDSQLYLMGHLHQPLILPGWKEHRDKVRRQVVAKKYVAALGSSFMDLWGSYGEVAGFGMSDVLMPLTRLDVSGGWEVVLR